MTRDELLFYARGSAEAIHEILTGSSFDEGMKTGVAPTAVDAKKIDEVYNINKTFLRFLTMAEKMEEAKTSVTEEAKIIVSVDEGGKGGNEDDSL